MGDIGLWVNTSYPPTEVCLWFLVFGHLRIEGKEMWTWRSLGSTCSLQAQDHLSHIETLDIMPLSLPDRILKITKVKEGMVSKRSLVVKH